MWANLPASKKKELFVKVGMKPEHITKFSTDTLPFNQMNPVMRRKIIKLMNDKNEQLTQQVTRLHEREAEAKKQGKKFIIYKGLKINL